MKKPLPKIQGPILTCHLPVSNKDIKFRPFTVNEQKSLMLANESQDPTVIYDTIRELMLACTFGELDTNTIASADVAFFFIKLRIQSVGSELRFSLKCQHCDEDVIINYSLDDLQVDMKNYKDTVMLDGGIGMKFRVPSMYDARNLDVTSTDSILEMLHEILDVVFDAEQVYEKSDYTLQEFVEWIGDFNDNQLQSIYDWVTNIPELRHELKFVCNHCHQENRRLLEGLHAFFRLGDDT